MGNEASIEMEGERLIHEQDEDNLWSLSLYRGSNGEGEGGCVFTGNKNQADFCRAAVEHLRLLRHPNVIKFLGSDTSCDKIQLFTEPLVPVTSILEETNIEGVVMGWRGVGCGLGFLHEKAGLSHNNVNVSCVYVSVIDSQWRLGGFETVHRHRDINPSFLSSVVSIRHEKAIPPEDKVKSSMATATPPHSRDVWALGHFVLTILEKASLEDQLSDSSFQYISDDLLNPDPNLRPTISAILSQPWMNNQTSVITDFINNLTLKTKAEKDVFFLCLMDELHSLPPLVVAEHIVPLMVTPLVMSEPLSQNTLWKHVLLPVSPENPRQKAFDHTLSCPLLSQDLFKSHVLPLLLNLMKCHDYHVRFILLEHLRGYAPLCTQEDLVGVVLPEVLLGLKDQRDGMVEATLHGLGDLVPFVGADAVIGTSRKHVFTDSQPRANNPNVDTIRTPPSQRDSHPKSTPPPSGRRSGPPRRSKPTQSREERLREMKEKREQQRQKKMEKTKKLGHVTSLSMHEDSDSEAVSKAIPINYSPSISHDDEVEGAEVSGTSSLLEGSEVKSELEGSEVKPNPREVDVKASGEWDGVEEEEEDDDWGESWSDMEGSVSSHVSVPVNQVSVSSPTISQVLVPESKKTFSLSGKASKLVLKSAKEPTKQNQTRGSVGGEVTSSPKQGGLGGPWSGGMSGDLHHHECLEDGGPVYHEQDLFADMIPNIKPTSVNAFQYQPKEMEATGGDWATEEWNDHF